MRLNLSRPCVWTVTFLPEGQGRCGLLGSLPVGLAFFRAVDATETDAFSMVAVQHFDGVAIEDGDDVAVILRASNSGRWDQEGEEHNEGPQSRHQSQPHEGLNRFSQQRARPFSQPHTPP